MEFTKLFDVFTYQQAHNPLEVALAEKVEGKWQTWSTAEVIDKINEVSRGLYSLGIRPGDKVAIIATNRPAWNWIDIGLLQLGAITVPVYPNISVNDYLFIFTDAEVKMAFVQDKALYTKIKGIQEQLPDLRQIFTFKETPGLPHWTEILKDEANVPQEEIHRLKANVQADDMATIIYTSGTTGTPKGVMLSHTNIISNIKASAAALPIRTYHRVLSSLPICHIFERMVCYLYMYVGASIYYAERVESLGEALKEVKPNFMSTVPRILEKLYEKIMQRGQALTGIKRKLFDWAIRIGLQYESEGSGSIWYKAQLKLARKLVFSKWQDAVGGEFTGIVSGAAALQPRLAAIFNAAGIWVREGYGQTESSPVIAVNRFEEGESMIGTVGIPLDNVIVKIADDGEICVKGPNVMLGYYKRPDLTAQAIDQEGWLHTGDVGKLINGKFLKITDRKKELFKTSGGKYVAPQVIENRFKESFLIDQIIVVGENRKTISALIAPAIPSLTEWCEQSGLKFNSKQEMLRAPEVIKKYGQIRDEFNRHFSDVEKVKKIALVEDEWSVDSGEMTPTLKLKRKVIQEKYAGLIAELYKDE